jgi:hypothetical protein
VWDAKKIGDMIIASGEAGSRPRRLVRHFDDVDHALHKALDKLEGVPAFRRTDKPADVLHYLCLDPIDLWDHHQIGGKPAAATYLRGKLAPTLRWLKTSTARNQAKVIEAKGLFEAIFEWLGEPMYMDRRTKAHRKPTASATERPMFGDAEDFGTANFSEEDLRFELELAAPHDVGEFHDSVDLSVSEPLTPEEVFIRALNAFPPERFDNLVRRAELIRRPVQEAVQASPKGRVALAREALTKVVTSARTLFGRRPHADE